MIPEARVNFATPISAAVNRSHADCRNPQPVGRIPITAISGMVTARACIRIRQIRIIARHVHTYRPVAIPTAQASTAGPVRSVRPRKAV